jgi:hypothetical protein
MGRKNHFLVGKIKEERKEERGKGGERIKKDT